jgi:hypothetical protein
MALESISVAGPSPPPANSRLAPSEGHVPRRPARLSGVGAAAEPRFAWRGHASSSARTGSIGRPRRRSRARVARRVRPSRFRIADPCPAVGDSPPWSALLRARRPGERVRAFGDSRDTIASGSGRPRSRTARAGDHGGRSHDGCRARLSPSWRPWHRRFHAPCRTDAASGSNRGRAARGRRTTGRPDQATGTRAGGTHRARSGVAVAAEVAQDTGPSLRAPASRRGPGALGCGD